MGCKVCLFPRECDCNCPTCVSARRSLGLVRCAVRYRDAETGCCGFDIFEVMDPSPRVALALGRVRALTAGVELIPFEDGTMVDVTGTFAAELQRMSEE